MISCIALAGALIEEHWLFVRGKLLLASLNSHDCYK